MLVVSISLCPSLLPPFPSFLPFLPPFSFSSSSFPPSSLLLPLFPFLLLFLAHDHSLPPPPLPSDSVSPKRGRKITIKICTRFHFSSALKRMSCIASMQMGTSGPTYMVTTKGAPETLRDMFESSLEDYDVIHIRLARQGARILALGYRELGSLSLREVSIVH